MFKKWYIQEAKKFLKLPDAVFSEDIPMSYYVYVTFERVLMLIRGFFWGSFLGKCGKRLFIGRRTKLICKKKIFVGDGVSIQDQVEINALSREGVALGNNVSIGMRTIIRVSGSLSEVGKGFKIGNYSAMGNDCFIGAAGGVEIGDYVAIGQNVRFHSENHAFSDPDKMICRQGTTHEGIKIGNDCWIGAGAVFLDGSEIGDGCVVGANALVSKKFESYSVIAGVPAIVIKKRK